MSVDAIVAEEVADALDGGRAVVALETAVLTHGLPPDTGLLAMRAMSAAVRASDAVPAAIAVVEGRLRVGLEETLLERLVGSAGVRKCGLRELPAALAQGATGGTTVSATVWLAHHVGVSVVSTGGIGGVHRGPGLDVSADLLVLARAPVVLVCSGPKTLVDVAATAEALEALAVPVLGYGTDTLPTFYVEDAGVAVAGSVASAAEVAAVARERDRLRMSSAVVVTVPVPREAALRPDEVERAVAVAEGEARAAGVRGRDVTPWILDRLATLTNGSTVRTNVALLENNSRIAGEIAAAM